MTLGNNLPTVCNNFLRPTLLGMVANLVPQRTSLHRLAAQGIG
jgi:hypothetical protein